MSEIYFGVNKREKFYLDPKKEQWIEFKKLTEGELIKFEDSVGGKVTMDADTRKSEVESKSGSERKALVELAVCGYNVRVAEGKDGFKSGYDLEEWRKLYESMDGDMAKKLAEKVKDFNGLGAKKN
jgi:hypothetical protein